MDWVKWWREHSVLQKRLEKNKNGPKFYFLHGPPYVTNELHVGNMRNYVYHDAIIRFKLHDGFRVLTKPGLDTHGLPIEVKVEEKLGISGKRDIEEKIGVENFIRACREFVDSYAPKFREAYASAHLIYSLIDDEYITYKREYIARAMRVFKKLWEMGYVYRGKKPVWWCPRCKTTLANYEVFDKYVDRTDPSIFIKFPVKGEEKTYLLVWTTTPWTLPANVAIAAHPDETYVKVKVGDEVYILAKERLVVLEELGLKYEVIEEFPGRNLDGLEYEPVIDSEVQRRIRHRVVMSIPLLKGRVGAKVLTKKEAEATEEFEHLVDVSEGTGLVHIAPAHGREDYELGEHYGLPAINVAREDGTLENAGPFDGLYFLDANEKIIEYLKERGLLLHAGKITHKYPLCWRCKTPLLYRMSEQWFIAVSKFKDKLIELNERIKWVPEGRKEQMRKWLEGVQDWAISRQRYWGIPIPVWVCEKCGHVEVYTLEELEEKVGRKIEDPHKHELDKIVLKCPKCGGEMRRIPDVFDVWYDSGAAPFASVSDEEYEEYKPVDAICEAQDQMKGWFYTLLVLTGAYNEFKEVPYRKVHVTGWVLDWKGEKMSKSLGNVIFVKDAIKELGPDVFRAYYFIPTKSWLTMNYNLQEAKRLGFRFVNVVRNLVKFVLDYWNVPNEIGEERIEDTWIREKWKETVIEFRRNMEELDLKEAFRVVHDFILEYLSRTYVKLIRERVREDKKPLLIMRDLLREVLAVVDVFTPGLAEESYQRLREILENPEESVLLENIPRYSEYDEGLVREFERVLEAVEEILSLRQELGIRTRWPVKYVYAELEGIDLSKYEGVIKKLVNALEFSRTPRDDTIIREFEGGKVGLAKEVDEELAVVGEVARRIQNLRKEMGLKVDQRVRGVIEGPEFLKKYLDYLSRRTNVEFEWGKGEREISFEVLGKEYTVRITINQ